MVWSYDSAISRDVDAVRFLVGDTDSTDQQLQDEEIDFLLTDEGSRTRAAAEACERIAAKYARKVDYTVGSVKESLAQKAKAYRDLAQQIRRKQARGVVAFAGGLSVSGKEAALENEDLVQDVFTKGMETEYGTESLPDWNLLDPDIG